MPPSGDCSFVLLASPRDLEFVDTTLHHLLRACAYPFTDVILVADDLPKRGLPDRKVEFFQHVRRWLDEHTITKCVRLSTISPTRLSRKYFGSRISAVRDHRDVPLFGWIAGLEAAQTDFVVHFDSDILLHQAPGHSWIQEGMALIQEDSSALFVAPRPGPPTQNGTVHTVFWTADRHGNYRYKEFSSRKFLVSKQRLEELLPTRARYISRKRRWLMRFGIGNAILPWEYSVHRAMQNSKYHYVCLRSPQAWALHCPDHGSDWVRALPWLIQKIEAGEYPAQQAGHYDLALPAWI